MMQVKKELRKACLARRLALPEDERRGADEALCRLIAESEAFRKADLLFLFLPMRAEPDLTPLARIARERGIPAAYPRCADGVMTFYLDDGRDFTPDCFGIPAPPPDAPLALPSEQSLCILPGLAAGRDGTRLGYGGGFYDRFLADFGGKTLFPVYSALLFDTLPTEATDRTVDLIVTEKGEI